MYISDQYLGAAFALVAGFLALHFFTSDERPDAAESSFDGTIREPSPDAATYSATTDQRLPTGAESSRHLYNILESGRRHIQPMLDADRPLEARKYLLEQAAHSSRQQNRNALGYHLVLLGEVSIETRDLAAAQLYLEEAIEAFEQGMDGMGRAYAYMQLGRMHIKTRAIARHASDAYNMLLVARNQIHNYQYAHAENNLRGAIAASLEIDRYGTAASAYESLANVKRITGQTMDADQSMFEAAELYAASGQERRAHAILESLARDGVDPSRIAIHEQIVRDAVESFRISVDHVMQSRDYSSLYHQYRHAGDATRAWEFRIKATEVLAQSSRRAMYHRHPDVVALLYVSNNSISHAGTFVQQAASLFMSEGAVELAGEASRLTTQIY